MTIPSDLARRYPDGVVVFDPVTGCTSSLSFEGAELVATLCAMIDGGLRDREALIAAVRTEAGQDPAAGAFVRDDVQEANLAHWVDLALHLNA